MTLKKYRVFRDAFARFACYEQRGACFTASNRDAEAGAMLGFLWAIIVGFVAGTLAKFIMPGRDPGGFIVTILLGIGGSVVATWLGRTLGWYHGQQSARFIGSIVGAVIILAIYRVIVRNRGNPGGPRAI